MGIIDRTKHYLKYLVDDTAKDTATLAKLQIERAENFAKEKVDKRVETIEQRVAGAIKYDSLGLQARVAKGAEQVTNTLTTPVEETHKLIKQKGIYATQEKAVQGSESIRYINDSIKNVATAINNTLLPPAIAEMLNTPVKVIHDAIDTTQTDLKRAVVKTTVTASHNVNAAKTNINSTIEQGIAGVAEQYIQTPIVLTEKCLTAKTKQMSATVKGVAHNHIEQASDAAQDLSEQAANTLVNATHQKIDKLFLPLERAVNTVHTTIKPVINTLGSINSAAVVDKVFPPAIAGILNTDVGELCGKLHGSHIGKDASQLMLPDTLPPKVLKSSRER